VAVDLPARPDAFEAEAVALVDHRLMRLSDIPASAMGRRHDASGRQRRRDDPADGREGSGDLDSDLHVGDVIPDDVGSYVRVVVTGTNATGNAASTSGLTAAVDPAPPAPAAPANTVAASISGSAVAGEMLTADPGTWTGTPAPTFAYQWQRCSDSADLGTCSDIAGATGSTYQLVDPDDVGSYVRVVVTGTNDSGTDTSTSELTDQVAGS
jgi:hypothetical protein